MSWKLGEGMSLKKPILWLYVGAGLIFLYSAMKLFAVIGPSAVLGTVLADQGATYFTMLSMGFEVYVQEAAKKYGTEKGTDLFWRIKGSP